MNTNNLLTHATSPEFLCQSISDYTNKSAEDYQKILTATSQMIESIDDTSDEIVAAMSFDDFLSTIDATAQDLIRLPGGYANMFELYDFLQRSAVYYASDMSGAIGVPVLQLTNAVGERVTMEYDQFLEHVKGGIYSAVSLGAAAATATLDNVADRIAVYNDKLRTVFSEAYTNFGSIGSYMRGLITSSDFSIHGFLNSVTSLMGFGGSNLEDDVDNSDIHLYTGVTPAYALAWHAGLNTVTKAIGVALDAVRKILVGATALVVRGVHSVVNKIREAAYNPNDIYISSVLSTTPTFESWSYNKELRMEFSEDSEVVSYIFDHYDAFEKSVGHWYKTDTLFAEQCFRINEFSPNTATGGYVLYIDIQYKPKAIDPDVVYECLKPYATETLIGQTNIHQLEVNGGPNSLGMPTITEWNDFVSRLQSTPNLYLSGAEGEAKIAQGCLIALNFQQLVNQYSQPVPRTAGPATIRLSKWNEWYDANYTSLLGPSNLSLVRLASGWIEAQHGFFLDTPSFSDVFLGSSFVGGSAFHMGFMNTYGYDAGLTAIFVVSQSDAYLPYRKDVSGFANGRFSIKTDAANLQAWENLLTAAAIVTVAAVVSTVAIVACKSIATRLFTKRASFLQQMNAKMAKGEKLSRSEATKYRRLSLKANAAGKVTAGLQDGGAKVQDYLYDENEINQYDIIRLISG